MPDLSSLMQVAPYAGGFMAGQQNVADLSQKAAETQRLQELIQGLQIQNQQSKLMNPLLTQEQDLKNKGLQEGLPGITAESDSKRRKADFEKRTLDSDVSTHIDDNNVKVVQNEVKKRAAQGNALYTLAQQAQTMGPAGAAWMQQQMRDQLKIDPTNPLYQKSPAEIGSLGKSMITATEAYWQHIDGEEIKRKSQEKIAKGHDDTQMAIENARIEAGKYAKGDKTSFESYYSRLRSAKDKHAALIDEATKARLGKNNDLAADYLARAEAIRPQAEAEIATPRPGTPDVAGATNNRIPVNPSPNIAPPGAAGPGAAGAAQVAPPALAKALSQAGVAYEPNKYDYRVDPATGKLQRKPKGG